MDQNTCRTERCTVNYWQHRTYDHELDKNMIQFYNVSMQSYLNEENEVHFTDNLVNGDEASRGRPVRVRRAMPLRRNRDRAGVHFRRVNEDKTCENVFIFKFWKQVKHAERKLDRVKYILWAQSKQRLKNSSCKFVARSLRSLLFELETQEDILSLAADHDKSPKFIASKATLLHFCQETKEQVATLKIRRARNWYRNLTQKEVSDGDQKEVKKLAEPSSPELYDPPEEEIKTAIFNIKFGHGDEVSVPKLKGDINGLVGYNGLIEGSSPIIATPKHSSAATNASCPTAEAGTHTLTAMTIPRAGKTNVESRNLEDVEEVELVVPCTVGVGVDESNISRVAVEINNNLQNEKPVSLPSNSLCASSSTSNEDLETGRAGPEIEAFVGESPQEFAHAEVSANSSRSETKNISTSVSNDGYEKLPVGNTDLTPKTKTDLSGNLDYKPDHGQSLAKLNKPKYDERPTTSSKLPCVKNEPLKITREPPRHGSCASATAAPDDDNETESSGEEAERLQREKFHKMRRKNGKIKKEYKCELRRKQKEDFIAKIKAQEEAKNAKRKALKSKNENDDDAKPKDVKSKAYGKFKSAKEAREVSVSDRRKKKGDAIEDDVSKQDEETRKHSKISKKENNVHISDQALYQRTSAKAALETSETFGRRDEWNGNNFGDQDESDLVQTDHSLTDVQTPQSCASSSSSRKKKKPQQKPEDTKEESSNLHVRISSNLDRRIHDKAERLKAEEEKRKSLLEFMPNEFVLSDILQHIWDFKELPEEILSEDYWEAFYNSETSERAGQKPPEVVESDAAKPPAKTILPPPVSSAALVKFGEDKEDHFSNTANDFSSDVTLEDYLPTGVTLKQLPRSGFQKYLNDCVKYEFETSLFKTPVVMMDLLPDVIKDVIASARDSWRKLTPAQKKDIPDDTCFPGEVYSLKLLRSKFTSEEHYERAVANSLCRYYKNYFDQQPKIDRPLPVILHRKPILEALKENPVFMACVILVVIGAARQYVYGWLRRSFASWWFGDW